MISNFQTFLGEIGERIFDAFVLPADFLLSVIVAHAPGLATKLGILGNDRSATMLFILSLIAWMLLTLFVHKILMLWHSLVRNVSAIVRTIVHRASSAMGNLKTRLVCKLRQLMPGRGSSMDPTGEMHFDDLELAVLRSAAARGPGFTTSAPELAEQMTMRPAKIQRCLEKLTKNRMLDYAIGETDGFENYRLSPLGSAFMAQWQQQKGTP